METTRYSDNMDFIGDGPLIVKARIFLLPTEQGGKSNPVGCRYRPNHNFGDAENRHFFIGQVELREGELLHPGETKDLLIRFFDVRGLREMLVPGAKWRIQEGSMLVATAEVIAVLT